MGDAAGSDRTDDRSAAGGDAEPSPDDADGSDGRPCPLCGASMRHRHCKYVCPNHGVVYDCSDTFY